MKCDTFNISVNESNITFYQKTKTKSRKEYKCKECGKIININEKCITENGRTEDGWFCIKTCLDCYSIRTLFFSCGYNIGELWDDTFNVINSIRGNVPEDCIAKLPPAARGKVCDLVEKILKFWN